MHDLESHRDSVRPVDRQLLEALGRGEELRVGQLVEQLGVTATAIRQRLDRMQEAGLIERRKLPSPSRGRPTFAYALTRLGRRQTSGDYTDLAEALWQELRSVGDDAVREQLLERVARRLGESYREKLGSMARESSDERLRDLAKALVARRIIADVEVSGPLPVLELHTCPYPDLATGSERGEMCRLEEQAFSAAVGRPMHLASCRMEGESCCRFTLADDTADGHSTPPDDGVAGTARSEEPPSALGLSAIPDIVGSLSSSRVL
jgi:predicted ArsR family transcriptional regulator